MSSCSSSVGYEIRKIVSNADNPIIRLRRERTNSAYNHSNTNPQNGRHANTPLDDTDSNATAEAQCDDHTDDQNENLSENGRSRTHNGMDLCRTNGLSTTQKSTAAEEHKDEKHQSNDTDLDKRKRVFSQMTACSYSQSASPSPAAHRSSASLSSSASSSALASSSFVKESLLGDRELSRASALLSSNSFVPSIHQIHFKKCDESSDELLYDTRLNAILNESDEELLSVYRILDRRYAHRLAVAARERDYDIHQADLCYSVSAQNAANDCENEKSIVQQKFLANIRFQAENGTSKRIRETLQRKKKMKTEPADMVTKQKTAHNHTEAANSANSAECNSRSASSSASKPFSANGLMSALATNAACPDDSLASSSVYAILKPFFPTAVACGDALNSSTDLLSQRKPPKVRQTLKHSEIQEDLKKVQQLIAHDHANNSRKKDRYI